MERSHPFHVHNNLLVSEHTFSLCMELLLSALATPLYTVFLYAPFRNGFLHRGSGLSRAQRDVFNVDPDAVLLGIRDPIFGRSLGPRRPVSRLDLVLRRESD